MAKSPRITVLMTLYNKGAFVGEAVQSVLAQTYTDLELLVVDDASTDGGMEKVKAIADPRIRMLESSVNTGRAAAANRGYEAATGDYIAVLDADDLMHPERLAKQAAFMDAHPEVGACGSWIAMLGNPGHRQLWPTTDAECRAHALFGNPLCYGSGIFRRSVIAEHALRCKPDWRWPGMDYLFLLHFHRYTQYANLPEVLLQYRMGANNMGHGRDPVEDRARLIPAVFGMFGLPLHASEVDLQLALHAQFRRPFKATDVRALRAWIAKLKAENRAKGLFDTTLFEADLERRWDRLFHYLADRDLDAAITHLRLSGHLPKDRAMYLAKTTLRRWGGHKA